MIPSAPGHVVVVGGGIFGVTAALALRERGIDTTLCDAGPVPHPLAESTDISKIVRIDYGGDAAYTAMMEDALPRWRAWNASFPEPLFHETGLLFLSRGALAKGGFEHDSLNLLASRGHALQRLDAAAIQARFPAFGALWVDGYYNPVGGHAESGRVVEALCAKAVALGVKLRANAAVVDLLDAPGGHRIGGVVLEGGERLAADGVVVAAGAWTRRLVPELAGFFREVGQPVFHLRPPDRSRFEPSVFPVFGADIARTGYYGFPIGRQGVVKIANHGPGRVMQPDGDRLVEDREEASLREFLRDAIPELATATLVSSRICVYGDTLDEHFLIAEHPRREGLVVSAGGSGHGFKFAPLLGEWAADALLRRPSPALSRFGWRTSASMIGQEQARHHG